MKRWIVVMAALLVVLLAACGDDDQAGDGDAPEDVTGQTTIEGATAVPGTPRPTSTLRPPAPRGLSVPQGDPQQFEAPFSAGAFVRESLAGNAVSPQTGGQRVSYLHPDGGHVRLTVYRFQTPTDAQRTVEHTLTSNQIDTLLEEPYYAPAVSYGVAQDAHGDYLATWSNDEWAYIARTSGERALLDEFLAVFPF